MDGGEKVMAYRKRLVPTGRFYERKDKQGFVVREEFMHEVLVDTNRYQPLVEDAKHRDQKP
jgi:hypothetical protein